MGVTDQLVVGLLHPGEMGAAVATQLREKGRFVLWASQGRSAATVERAEQAGLRDAGTVEELAEASDVILSVCPPHGALAVAGSIAGFKGIYVDANAVSPMTAREIASIVEEGGGQFVDGGIVGSPPRGRRADESLPLRAHGRLGVADLFRDTSFEPGSSLTSPAPPRR